jgi:hypothetical protein
MYTNYNGINYFIPKLENETNKLYNIRKWIICKQEPTNNNEFKQAEKIAKLYINSKFLNCKYNTSINNLIQENISDDFF